MVMRRRRRKGRRREQKKVFDINAWEPKTRIGRKVKAGEITSMEQIFDTGKPILEPEIIDVIIPDLESETISISPTQRTTDSGRKMQFRVIVVIGDHKGHVGIGVGKSEEIRPAIEYAQRDARKNIILVKKGCGSWECRCGLEHSLPQKVCGKYGSTEITLKPAPKGLGLAANKIVKKVLQMAGVKDIWSFSTGSTSNVYNMAVATIKALDSFSDMKPQPGGNV